MIINQINNTNDYIIKIIKNNIDIYNHNVLEKITNKIINVFIVYITFFYNVVIYFI